MFSSPKREYIIATIVAIALGVEFFYPGAKLILFGASIFGALPPAMRALSALVKRRITIDTFNSFALGISFATGEIRSGAFIVLMLTFADILDWHTKNRASRALEELLRLRPQTARKESGNKIIEIPQNQVISGDILIVESGERVPVDGIVIFGRAWINESLVTGESVPVEKTIGDNVFGSTLIESGMIKMRATNVGKDSTIERMAELIKQATKNKARSERLADRFAAMFLPIVLVIGFGTYILTKNILMMAAVFLVACADDMAVAIPLALTAALGQAAKRGVIIKGGEWLETLSKTKTFVFDKTGTLTYGKFVVSDYHLEPHVSSEEFWYLVAIAEKFSSHPIGKAIFHEAAKRLNNIPDPDEFRISEGNGIIARIKTNEVIIGDEHIFAEFNIPLSENLKNKLHVERKEHGATTVLVAINKTFAGMITVDDVPRPEAKESISALKELGITKIIMFTGDNEVIASRISTALGIDNFYASMNPEDKLRELERLEKNSIVAMVGDGINDAPALARADVGIAMGGSGAAVTVEAANIVILTDDLSRLPEMLKLSRRTLSVIKGDAVLWVLTNAIGFTLVLTGLFGPALAAFYNFATDFLPLLNSARLFRNSSKI
jgi:Cu+-exporting ATPase